MKRYVGGIIAVMLATCSGPSAPNGGPLTGSWYGSASGIQLELSLKEKNGNVTGTGELIPDSSAVSVTVSGSEQDKNVSLSLATLTGAVSYSGVASSNYGVITGTLHIGGGLGADLSIDLSRVK